MNIPHAQVEALLREAADKIVMPLWRNLGRDDVTEKSAGDLTTTADTRCEAFLYLVVWNGRTVPEKGNGGSSRHTRDSAETFSRSASVMTSESDALSSWSAGSVFSSKYPPMDSEVSEFPVDSSYTSPRLINTGLLSDLPSLA